MNKYKYIEQRDEIYETLNRLMGWNELKCKEWYTKPHKWFDNYTPHQMVLRKRGKEVIDFLRECEVR